MAFKMVDNMVVKEPKNIQDRKELDKHWLMETFIHLIIKHLKKLIRQGNKAVMMVLLFHIYLSYLVKFLILILVSVVLNHNKNRYIMMNLMMILDNEFNYYNHYYIIIHLLY